MKYSELSEEGKQKKRDYVKAYRKTEAGRFSNLKYKDKVNHGSLKHQVLVRDNYRCRACDKNLRGLSRDTIIHHKDGLGLSVPRDSRNHEIDNQETLCRSCHLREHMLGKQLVVITKEQIEVALANGTRMVDAAKKLNVSRWLLAKRRKFFGMPLTRKSPNKQPLTESNNLLAQAG